MHRKSCAHQLRAADPHIASVQHTLAQSFIASVQHNLTESKLKELQLLPNFE
jgi:hypothetical protein